MKMGLFNPFFTGNYANPYYYSAAGYSTEYQAVLDRATTLTYTKPDKTRNDAWDVFIKARKADGSLAIMDVLYNFQWNNASLQNFASLNHISPSANQASYVNSPTYGVKGIKGNASTSYVSIYNPVATGVKYLRDSASRGMYVSTAPGTGNALDGLVGSTNNRMVGINAVSQKINQGSSNLNVAVNFAGTGYRAINRSDNTNVQAYTGVTKSLHTATSAALDNEAQVLGQNSGSFSDTEFGMYYMGGSLTETQHNNIRNDYLTFLTAIGL